MPLYMTHPIREGEENHCIKSGLEVVQYWEGAFLPAHVKKFGNQIKALQGEYNIYNKSSAIRFIEEFYGDEFSRLFDMAWHPAMQADIFRILYCAKRNAVYVDADWCLNKRIVRRREEKAFLPVEGQAMFRVTGHGKKFIRYIVNDFVYLYGSGLAEVFVERLYRNLKEVSEVMGQGISLDPYTIHRETGPGLIRSALEEEGITLSSADVAKVVAVGGKGAPVYNTKFGELLLFTRAHAEGDMLYPDVSVSKKWYEKGVASDWREPSR